MNKLTLKGSAKYLNKEYKLGTKNLDYVMINLPFKCNYNCLKCCNQKRISSKKKIKIDKIKKFILKCKKEGARVVVVAGEGEPTINKHFKDLIQFINNNKLIPYIFTNGSMLNKKLALFLFQNNATLIINLDSINKNRYEKFTSTKDSFDQIMKNIDTTRRLYKNSFYDDKNKISSLAINMVLNTENYQEVENIEKFCGNDIVFVLNKPINIGSAMESKIFKNIEKIIQTEKNPLGTLTKKSQCSYLRNGISINSEGKILTCAYALETKDLYGDIDDDIKVIRKKVLKSVTDFYKKNGSSRCVLRHSKYKNFI